jgi:hypothetical protein
MPATGSMKSSRFRSNSAFPGPRRPAHTDGNLTLFQAAQVVVAGVLRVAVGVVHQPGTRRPSRNGPVQRLQR